jgi:arylsulfatase A-like enzyme
VARPAARRRPNILFLFPDQLRYDWIAGDPKIPVRTPNLDRLAARGTRFTKAIVASPLCAPSRACLASGKEYPRCGVASNGVNYPLAQTTYYSLLRESGYHVAGCGKLDLHKATLDWGLDGKRLLSEWGFSDGIDNAGKFDAIRSGADTPKDPYMAYLHAKNLAAEHVADMQMRRKMGYPATFPTPLPETAYCDNWVANNGFKLMRRFLKNKPWHLVVNFTGPHNPEDITRRMDSICRGRTFPQPNRSTQYDAKTHNAIRQNYSAMVENIDRLVGEFISEVDRRGEMENTLIVFSSDHGEMLGDHDRWGKTLPYHASASVPLIVAGPGVERGVRSEALVSVMDLAATYLEYAGVRRPADMDSRSIRPVLEGRSKTHREVVYSGLQRWRMAWDGRYKFIRGFEPEPVLFDLERDPHENENAASHETGAFERLSKALAHAS